MPTWVSFSKEPQRYRVRVATQAWMHDFLEDAVEVLVDDGFLMLKHADGTASVYAVGTLAYCLPFASAEVQDDGGRIRG